jgi:hypothetical protein
MAIDFPNAPILNQTYSVGDRTWQYDGSKWLVVYDTTVSGAIPDIYILLYMEPAG